MSRTGLVDLTRPLTEETIIALLGDSVSGREWDEYRRVRIEADQSLEEFNSAVNRFTLADHVGTHVDAPSHIIRGGADVDELDIDRLVGPAVVLDMRSADPDHGYTAEDFEHASPHVEPGDIVLLYSGYEDCGPEDRIHQTYVTPDGAGWLVNHDVSAVGCEPGGLEHCWDGLHTHNWDDVTVKETPWPTHQILLAKDIYIIEGLTNLDRILGRRVMFSALPLKIPGLSGSPVRAVAWPLPPTDASG
jgi:arylformamidase